MLDSPVAPSDKNRAAVQRYQLPSTVGIKFLETPCQGAYGTVLSSTATLILNKLLSRLANALRANSEAMMRLTADCRFKLPKYQVHSFYKMKPMKALSTSVSQ